MRWRGRRQSENVEDRRGSRPPMAARGGGGLLMIIGIVVVGRLMGCDMAQIQQALNVAVQVQQPGAAPGGGAAQAPAGPGVEDEASQMIGVILADTEDVWSGLFREQVRAEYRKPQLVLFEQMVRTGGCGVASAQTGPFYCPADQQIYVPPSFFDVLADRLNAPGDFAQAYVIAHEVAHHVQNLLGLNQKLQQVRQSGDEVMINQYSVRLELQADYLAGVWAHHAHREFNLLESGDVEEAIRAANQIGDDTLQMDSQGYTVPERYTHGTSEQRMRWFRRGLESGDLSACRLLDEVPYDQL